MKTRLFSLLCALLSLCLLVSCAPQKTEQACFVDARGQSITLTSATRAAALMGSFADLWCLAGGTVVAAVHDAWEDFDLPLAGATDLGLLHHPSVELLLASDAELVLASPSIAAHAALADTLAAVGVTVVYLDVDSFSDFLSAFSFCCQLTGRADLWERYGTAQQAEIDAILMRCATRETQRVLVLRASASSVRTKDSDSTVLGGILRDFPTVNVADAQGVPTDTLSLEAILDADVDAVFFLQAGDDMEAVKAAVAALFAEQPLWTALDAVREGRVYFMEKELFNSKPNARFLEAYRRVEEVLYED